MIDTAAQPPGIDHERVTAWFATHVPQAAPPLRFDRVAGGHSGRAALRVPAPA